MSQVKQAQITSADNTSVRSYQINIPGEDVADLRRRVKATRFPDELYEAPRSWAEAAYPKLMHYNKLEKGGHFAAWEQPELLVSELRTAFRTLR